MSYLSVSTISKKVEISACSKKALPFHQKPDLFNTFSKLGLLVFGIFKALGTYLCMPIQLLASFYRKQALRTQLTAWCQESSLDENRLEAKNRILECWVLQSPTLTLNGLKLKSLPACLSQLSQLQEVDVSQNRLQVVPFKVLSALSELHTLNLSHNQMNSLADGIGLLENLRQLDCSFNSIISISSEIRQLDKLERLSLRSNNLRELELAIGYLFTLKFLDCSQNQLKQVNVLENLYNLEDLDVSYNYSLIEINKAKLKSLRSLTSKTYSPQLEDLITT